MAYLVKIFDRAYRDLEGIYEFVGADSSDKALAWFKGLVEAIDSLEEFPERGRIYSEDRRFRYLTLGKKSNTYRVFYTVDKRNRAVSVVHIRHGARAANSKDEESL